MCLVRLEWTLEEFYAFGGPTAFADRVAGALGIHASTIKVISVYKGSVIIDYQVSAVSDDEEGLATLKQTSSDL